MTEETALQRARRKLKGAIGIASLADAIVAIVDHLEASAPKGEEAQHSDSYVEWKRQVAQGLTYTGYFMWNWQRLRDAPASPTPAPAAAPMAPTYPEGWTRPQPSAPEPPRECQHEWRHLIDWALMTSPRGISWCQRCGALSHNGTLFIPQSTEAEHGS